MFSGFVLVLQLSSARLALPVAATAVMAWAQPASAATIVAHIIKQGTGAGTTTTPAVDTTAGGGADLIVVAVSKYKSEACVDADVIDSAGNAYTMRKSQPSGSDSNQKICIWDKSSPLTSGAHTFSHSQAGDPNVFGSIAMVAINGSTGAPPFDTPVGSAADGAGGSGATPSIGAANEIVVEALGWYTNNPVAIDSGFTIQDQVGYLASNGEGLALATKEVSGAETPTWTWSGTNAAGAAAASYHIAGGGGATAKCGSGLLLRGVGCEVHP